MACSILGLMRQRLTGLVRHCQLLLDQGSRSHLQHGAPPSLKTVTRAKGGGGRFSVVENNSINQSPSLVSSQSFDLYHHFEPWTSPPPPLKSFQFYQPSSYQVWRWWCQLHQFPCQSGQLHYGSLVWMSNKIRQDLHLKGPVVGSLPAVAT